LLLLLLLLLLLASLWPTRFTLLLCPPDELGPGLTLLLLSGVSSPHPPSLSELVIVLLLCVLLLWATGAAVGMHLLLLLQLQLAMLCCACKLLCCRLKHLHDNSTNTRDIADKRKCAFCLECDGSTTTTAAVARVANGLNSTHAKVVNAQNL
jgi:hypothetical protein